MSDNWITIIPEDPYFVPGAASQTAARNWLERLAPDAEEIDIKSSDKVEFFDCGANLERIACPCCFAIISPEWWLQRMEDDRNDGFKLLEYSTPCCGERRTLHELIYDRPQGFGRFALDVMNPGIGKLSESQARELEEILGCRIRIIHQHL